MCNTVDFQMRSQKTCAAIAEFLSPMVDFSTYLDNAHQVANRHLLAYAEHVTRYKERRRVVVHVPDVNRHRRRTGALLRREGFSGTNLECANKRKRLNFWSTKQIFTPCHLKSRHVTLRLSPSSRALDSPVTHNAVHQPER